jgi:hypothetical protein
MPKPPHLPKYRLHKASGQAFVQVKGRRTYLGKYDSDESRERYGRIIAELTANPLVVRQVEVDRFGVMCIWASFPGSSAEFVGSLACREREMAESPRDHGRSDATLSRLGKVGTEKRHHT